MKEEGAIPFLEAPVNREWRALFTPCHLHGPSLQRPCFCTQCFPSQFLFPCSGSWSSLLPAAHTSLLSESTRRSQTKLLSRTHSPFCSGAACRPRSPIALVWLARSLRTMPHLSAPILPGAPLNSLPGGIQTKQYYVQAEYSMLPTNHFFL